VVLFVGIFLDSRALVIAGAAVLSMPVAVMIYRLVARPPSLVDGIEIAIGFPSPEHDLEPPSQNEAKAILRNTGEERRPK
jgi:hypothetical protein